MPPKGKSRSSIKYYGFVCSEGGKGTVSDDIISFTEREAAELLSVHRGRMQIISSPYDHDYFVFCTIVMSRNGFRQVSGASYIPVTPRERDETSNWRATAVCRRPVTGQAIIASNKEITRTDFDKFTADCYAAYTKDSGAFGMMKKKGLTLPTMPGDKDSFSPGAMSSAAITGVLSALSGGTEKEKKKRIPREDKKVESPPVVIEDAINTKISKSKKKKLAKKRREKRITTDAAKTENIPRPAYVIKEFDINSIL